MDYPNLLSNKYGEKTINNVALHSAGGSDGQKGEGGSCGYNAGAW